MTELTTDEALGVVERIGHLVDLIDPPDGGDPGGGAPWEQVLEVLREARALLAPAPPAPEMRIVTGFPRFADPRATDGDPEEYDGKPLEGLQCPYEDCGVVNWQGFDTEIRVEDGTWINLGVRVVDRGERWSAFRYDRGWVEEHEIRVVDGRRRWVGSGRQVEHRCIVGSYGDTPDMHTVRYECEACDRPVSLPADVSEDGQ
jgi:hypothetical protein